MRSVVSEPPCLSLDDCGRQTQELTGHHAGAMKITLAYPHLVALKQVESRLEDARQPGAQGQGTTVQEALRVLRSAKASQEPLVAESAAEIAARFGLAP
jgi:hypothetical protein